MATATQRAGTGRSPGNAPIRTSYHRYAGVRTRVHEVGQPTQQAQGKTARRRRSAKPSNQPRFVLFHGYCDSADTWRNLLGELEASGHSAIAIDLPGFGEADALRSGPILPQLDAFVRAVVTEQAEHGEVVLVGNSLGGTISLRAAQSAQLPVAGVVSIAAPGFSDTWLVRTVRRYPLPLRLYASLPVPVPGLLIRTVADNVVPRLLYATPRSRDDEEVRRFTALFPDFRSTRDRLAQARQLAGELTDCYEIDRVKAPLLIVTCGKDRLVRADSGAMLHSLVPHSRLLVREDWGHCPQLDHAEEIHQLVSYFAVGCVRPAKVPAPRRRKASEGPAEAAG